MGDVEESGQAGRPAREGNTWRVLKGQWLGPVRVNHCWDS